MINCFSAERKEEREKNKKTKGYKTGYNRLFDVYKIKATGNIYIYIFIFVKEPLRRIYIQIMCL